MNEHPTRLIYITSNMDSFFVNEIEAFARAFDDVLVIAYGEMPEKEAQLSHGLGVRTRQITTRLPPSLKEMWALLRWLRLEHVKREIRENCRGSHGLAKFASVLRYGHIAIRVDNALKEESFSPSEQVFFYSFWLTFGAYSSILLSRRYSAVKMVSRAHRFDVYSERNKNSYLPFRRYIAENLDEIYFISGHGRRYFEGLCRSGGFQNCALKVAHLGTFKQDALPASGSRTELVLASCSSVIPVKRLDLIIRLVKEVAAIYENVRWIHIGGGPLMESVKALAEDSLPGKYELLGERDNSEVFSLYAKCRPFFFINLSDSEGIPVSIMEALSMGIPALARNVGGNSEIVRDGKNGFLLPETVSDDDLRKAAAEIVVLFQDPARYQAYSSCAVKTWDTEFNAEKNNTAFINGFKSLSELASGEKE